MRMMMRVRIPAARGSEGIRDGSLARALEATAESVKPEAAYYILENGHRAALFVFDLPDQAQIPLIVGPLFQACDAHIELTPCMTPEEMLSGVAKVVSGA